VESDHERDNAIGAGFSQLIFTKAKATRRIGRAAMISDVDSFSHDPRMSLMIAIRDEHERGAAVVSWGTLGKMTS
jgi:hypothetical protein